MQGVLVTGDRHSVQYLVRVMAGMAEELPEAARAAGARAAAATAAVGRRDPGRVPQFPNFVIHLPASPSRSRLFAIPARRTTTGPVETHRGGRRQSPSSKQASKQASPSIVRVGGRELTATSQDHNLHSSVRCVLAVPSRFSSIALGPRLPPTGTCGFHLQCTCTMVPVDGGGCERRIGKSEEHGFGSSPHPRAAPHLSYG